MADLRSERHRVLDRYFAALNAGDAGGAMACYAPAARLEEVATGASHQGAAALRRSLDGFLGLFTGLRFEGGARIVAGDSVLCPYTLSATMARDLGPLRLRGTAIRLTGAQHIGFQGDAIILVRDFWDFAELAAQAATASPIPT